MIIAVALINYRLTSRQVYLARSHDAKTAIRMKVPLPYNSRLLCAVLIGFFFFQLLRILHSLVNDPVTLLNNAIARGSRSQKYSLRQHRNFAIAVVCLFYRASSNQLELRPTVETVFWEALRSRQAANDSLSNIVSSYRIALHMETSARVRR